MKNLFFAKVKENAIIPTKKDEDAGYDIYACIDRDIKVEPHETVMIPTGIATAFDSDYVMILKERGSTGTEGIGQRCGVIDSGFRGEIMVPITNTTDKLLTITKDNLIFREDEIVYPAQKAIAQAIMVEVPKLKVQEIELSELREIKSERGQGMLGSSGK